MARKTTKDEIKNMAAYQRVNRNASLLRSLSAFFKYISYPTDCVNELYLIIFINLIPQFAYVRFNHVCFWVKTVVPDMFQYHSFGDDCFAVVHEIFKQGILTGL